MSDEKITPDDNPGQVGPPDDVGPPVTPPGQAKKEVVFRIKPGEKPTEETPFDVVKTVVKEKETKDLHINLKDVEKQIRRLEHYKADSVASYDMRIKELEDIADLVRQALEKEGRDS